MAREGNFRVVVANKYVVYVGVTRGVLSIRRPSLNPIQHLTVQQVLGFATA